MLLAAAWRNTCWQLIKLPFIPTLTAVIFLLLNERFQLAGEWVVGGFEAKGIAYCLVILALGFMISDRWKFVWPLLGAAAMFHVLVGGWALLAAAFSWLVNHWPPGQPVNKSIIRQEQLLPFVAGIVLLGIGAIPPLLANQTASPENTTAANLIYVNERIAHHLTFAAFPTLHVARFTLPDRRLGFDFSLVYSASAGAQTTTENSVLLRLGQPVNFLGRLVAQWHC